MKNRFLLLLLLAGSLAEASQFLYIDPVAKYAAMGHVNNGTARGIHSLLLNPAGLGRGADLELIISHRYWAAGRTDFRSKRLYPQYEYLGIKKNIRLQSLGWNFFIYHQPALESEGISQTIHSGGTSAVWSICQGAFSAGARVKFFWEHLGRHSGGGISLDGGLQFRFDFLKAYKAVEPNFCLGLSFNNLGTPVTLDSIAQYQPFNVQTGFGWQIYGSTYLDVLTAFDGVIMTALDNFIDIFLRTGLDVRIMQRVSLRAGWQSRLYSGSGGTVRSLKNPEFSSGLGVDLNIKGNDLSLDYAFLLNLKVNRLISHIISLSYKI